MLLLLWAAASRGLLRLRRQPESPAISQVLLNAECSLLSACGACAPRALSKFYGQANRAISTRQLRVLPHFYSEPIKQVVFLRPLHP